MSVTAIKHDPEKADTISQAIVSQSKEEHDTNSATDHNLVTWDGPDDPANPLNWSKPSKWLLTILVSLFGFITLMASTMVAPALPQIAQQLHMGSSVEAEASFSIFVLLYGVGPLVWGPLAEEVGRVRILLIASTIFLVFNALCAASQSAGMLIAMRVLSGFGSSASVAVSGGILSDCWRREERGKSIAIASFIPLLGPSIGPMAAAALLERVSWRWVFAITTLLSVPVVLAGFFFLHESYAPVILERKAKDLRKATGNPLLHTVYDTSRTTNQSTRTRTQVLLAILHNLTRAIRLLFTHPVLWALSIFGILAFGTLYLFISAYASIWAQVYAEPIGIAGLNYLSYGIGLFVGTQLCARGSDYIFARLKARRGRLDPSDPNPAPAPEFRLALMAPITLLMPGALLILAFSAQRHLSPVLPNFGAFLVAIAYIVPYQLSTGYIVDSYPRYSASATAAVNLPRSIAAFGFPLFAPKMFATLGWDWGFGLLALLFVGFGIPVIGVSWLVARWWRRRCERTETEQ